MACWPLPGTIYTCEISAVNNCIVYVKTYNVLMKKKHKNKNLKSVIWDFAVID